MKLSLDWLSDYVDLGDLEPGEVAERLTVATAEVEELTPVRRHVKGVGVAEVRSVDAIDADASAVTLGVGDGRTATVVTTADHIPLGAKVAHAAPGAEVATGPIDAAEIRGRLSEGAVCSPSELGLGGADAVLQLLPDDVEAGTPLERILPATDVVIEIDNKSLTHRPDLWGHYGFARELAALYERPLRPLALIDPDEYADLPRVPLDVESEACRAYACVRIGHVTATPSPLLVQRRLTAIDQACVNALVDLSNYVMFELGQPVHTFDAEHAQHIRVAESGRQREFLALDGETRSLESSDLLIWDGDRPIALAGVIGGHDSAIRPDSTAVTLESANFGPVAVRRTQTRLGSRTEAGLRFEKDQPPSNAMLGLRRFTQLLTEQQPTATVTSRVAAEIRDEGPRTITTSVPDLRARIGLPLETEQVTGVLERLGFETKVSGDRLDVGVPPFRSARDISAPEDVLEEVARTVGYDRIPPELPRATVAPAKAERHVEWAHRVRGLLASAHEFTEVHTYGWFDDAWLRRLGYEPEGALRLLNPSTETTTRMRTTLLPNLLAVTQQNAGHRDRARVFELGGCYQRDGGGDEVDERVALAGVSWTTGKRASAEEHLRAVRGIVEDVLEFVRVAAPEYRPAEPAGTPWEEPGSIVELLVDDSAAGRFGLLPDEVARRFRKGLQVVWFEFDFTRLLASGGAPVTFAKPPPYPASAFDLSVVYDLDPGYGGLAPLLGAHEDPLLRRREFLYLYRDEALGADKGSYSFRFHLQADDHTLTPEEVTRARDRLVAHLAAHGVHLR